MFKDILRFVAKLLAILLAGGAALNLIQAGPDLQGPMPDVVSRVLAIVLSAALAWLLWRVGSKCAK